MPFVNIELNDEQIKKIRKETGEEFEGFSVLTDGSRSTIKEALRFVDRREVPLSAEDLLVRAIEGKLVGNAIVW